MTYQSTKTFGHDLGISCAFRQWRADSHCRFIHGYALAFKFTFECDELDVRNWCVDFGGLKSLKAMLETTFDHKTLVATDDPQLLEFKILHGAGVIDMVEVKATGCEATAELVYEVTEQWLKDAGFSPRCHLVSVEVAEHGGNSAIFFKPTTK